MPPDLTEDDKAALIELLRETIKRDRCPLSKSVPMNRWKPPFCNSWNTTARTARSLWSRKPYAK